MRQIPGGLGDRAPSSCPPENPGSGIPLPVGTNRPIGHTPLRRRDLARYDAFGERWGAGPSDLASVEPKLHDSGRSSCPSITPPRRPQQGRDLPASTNPRRVLCAGEAQALLAESLRPRSPRRNSCSAPPAAPGHLSPRMRPSRAAICLQALPWGRLRPDDGKQGCQASVLCGWTSKTHMPAYHAGGPAMPFRRPEAGMVDRDIRRVWRGTPLLPGGTTPSLPLTGPRADRRWTRRRHLRRRWGVMRPTESSRDMPLVRASRGRASRTRFRT